MRSKGGKTIRLNPVDEDDHVQDHPARAGLEAIMDQKLFAQRIKSERSAAYWFAASLWGMSGLVIGACLGAIMSIMVQTGSVDIWRGNFISGMAADEARDTVNNRESLLNNPQNQPPQQP
jgi:hypothetical protein